VSLRVGCFDVLSSPLFHNDIGFNNSAPDHTGTGGCGHSLPYDPSPPSYEGPSLEEMARPPKRLVLALFERSNITFFNDSCLGQLELPLSSLSDEKPLREWLPLSSGTNKSSTNTWFVHVQISIKYSLMMMEKRRGGGVRAGAGAGAGGGGIGGGIGGGGGVTGKASSAKTGAGTHATATPSKAQGGRSSLLGHLDDIF